MACPIAITHKAMLAPAQQGSEGTCQHVPPESFLLYPWLTHGKSQRKLPPQHSLEHVRTGRGKGFSTEGSKRDGGRAAKRSRNKKQDMGCFNQQVTGSRDQHRSQPYDSDLWGGHCCILFPRSDPSAPPRWMLPGPYDTSKACAFLSAYPWPVHRGFPNMWGLNRPIPSCKHDCHLHARGLPAQLSKGKVAKAEISYTRTLFEAMQIQYS